MHESLITANDNDIKMMRTVMGEVVSLGELVCDVFLKREEIHALGEFARRMIEGQLYQYRAEKIIFQGVKYYWFEAKMRIQGNRAAFVCNIKRAKMPVSVAVAEPEEEKDVDEKDFKALAAKMLNEVGKEDEKDSFWRPSPEREYFSVSFTVKYTCVWRVDSIEDCFSLGEFEYPELAEKLRQFNKDKCQK
jgi:hypothetical protein